MKLSTVVARILTVGVLVAVTSATAQQAYPIKPIRIIVPYPSGGGSSVVPRLIGQKLTESWGQQVLVDHRPGGNTIIGSQALVKSPPDGYTIILVAPGFVINPSLLALPYDTIKDFAPVASVTSAEYLLVLHPSVPANNLQEFIALAKSRPGQLNYPSTGAGGLSHLAGALFEVITGTRMQHIPYKGTGQILPDLLGGQVQVAFTTPSTVVNHIKTGQLKAIAVTGETRMPALPQVPTFTEAGLPGYAVKNTYGILAPAGTPKEIIDKLSTEIGKILAMSDIKEKLASLGLEPFYSTPDQFAAFIRAEIAKYAKIIKSANIKAEN